LFFIAIQWLDPVRTIFQHWELDIFQEHTMSRTTKNFESDIMVIY